ncbi:MAG TPA: hydrogenase maturation protease [Firmicutes bacterium]|nr:hydrogenase maturation protease [Bacillota bacterium]
MKIIVLGLGNELICDDGVGIFAARILTDKLRGVEGVDVIETSVHGIALMDFFIDYDKAILIDAITTGKHPPGTILELGKSDFRAVMAPSPHYSGLPEMLAIARELEIDFPDEFVVFAVEAGDVLSMGEPMTHEVESALPEVCGRVCTMVEKWVADG